MRPRGLSLDAYQKLGAFIAGLLDLGAGANIDALELCDGDWKIDVLWTWDGAEHGFEGLEVLIGRVAFTPDDLENDESLVLVESLGKAASLINGIRSKATEA